jgi:sulfatase modifying factor 1
MNLRAPAGRDAARAHCTRLLLTAPLVLAACTPAPPAAPAIVVVIPTATASVADSAPEETPAMVCPPLMAFVAGGSGRSDDKQRRINDLCMDVTEVTSAAYATCVDHGLCSADELSCEEAWTYKRPGLEDHPINCVSWAQADRYCRASGKRLPTSDEWEWAARARTEQWRFSWGDSDPADDQLCWSKGTARSGTCMVGSFPASRTPQGIDDLFGGVWEWLSPAERRGIPNIARGGAWQNSADNVLEGENPGSFAGGFARNDVVGFRCVYDGRGDGRVRSQSEDADAE